MGGCSASFIGANNPLTLVYSSVTAQRTAPVDSTHDGTITIPSGYSNGLLVVIPLDLHDTSAATTSVIYDQGGANQASLTKAKADSWTATGSAGGDAVNTSLFWKANPGGTGSAVTLRLGGTAGFFASAVCTMYFTGANISDPFDTASLTSTSYDTSASTLSATINHTASKGIRFFAAGFRGYSAFVVSTNPTLPSGYTLIERGRSGTLSTTTEITYMFAYKLVSAAGSETVSTVGAAAARRGVIAGLIK